MRVVKLHFANRGEQSKQPIYKPMELGHNKIFLKRLDINFKFFHLRYERQMILLSKLTPIIEYLSQVVVNIINIEEKHTQLI